VTFELGEDEKPRRRQILFIRTGTFLDYAEYSQEKMYAPGIVGAAILTLGVNEHTKRADTSATLSRET